MFLLDTNVVSELRRSRPHGAVLAWLDKVPEASLHLSAMTIGEIQAGIEITRVQDRAKAQELEEWLDRLSENFEILALDAAVLRGWARLMHGRPRTLIEDAMIGATALVWNLTVVTRNTRDFAALGVPSLNPFTPLSPQK